MTWITTNTIAGPLTSDNYYFTITGLSASTKYQYRAYFIVDGVEYYGNILTGTTAAITLYNPTVTTGNISGNITTSGFDVYNNNITNTGGASIIEHGILYTQQAIYGNNTGLIYSNFPNVCKASSFSGVTSIPYTYSARTNNLTPNTLTYYRAFAKNARGIGYGAIYTQQTASIITYRLTINFINLIGIVEKSPDLINYPAGSTVLLTAVDDATLRTGSYFQYWEYNGNIFGDYELYVDINNDTVVNVYFSDIAI